MDVKGKLRKLMEQHGWSEYRLAKEAGLSQTTISNVFRRNNAPSLSTLETLCTAFGITLSQFFAEEAEAVQLTAQQQELFRRWVALTPAQKELLFQLMEEMK